MTFNHIAGYKLLSSPIPVVRHLSEKSKMEVTENGLPSTAGSSPVVPLRQNTESASARLAATHLMNGEVIAVPTDTIYGIGCLVQDPAALGKLYAIKGRHPEKPVSICVGEIDDVYRWADVRIPRELLESLLPGPVTLFFRRQKVLNPDFNPGVPLVGVRIPDHAFIRNICREVRGAPVALTSANISNTQSCLAVSEFLHDLVPRGLTVAFDGGRLCRSAEDEERCRLGSTIVDLSHGGNSFSIARPGSALENTVNILKSFGLKEL